MRAGKYVRINERNLRAALRESRRGKSRCALLSGKGEPTLYPRIVRRYLESIRDEPFSFRELQTNGLGFGWLIRDGESRIKDLTRDDLVRWADLDLNTIALSAVHWETEPNSRVYHKDYPALDRTIGGLREMGFTVRLCVMMLRGYVSEPEHFEGLMEFCRANDVGQCTVRPIRSSYASKDDEVTRFVAEHAPTDEELARVQGYIDDNATWIDSLMHGAEVYDFCLPHWESGRNLCVSDCLTVNRREDAGKTRSLIFFSDGTLTTSWDRGGAVILQGDPNY